MTARQMTMSIGCRRRMIPSKRPKLGMTATGQSVFATRLRERSERRIDIMGFISSVGVDLVRVGWWVSPYDKHAGNLENFYRDIA